MQLDTMKTRGEKITALTAYDASFARLLDRAGVEIILVGDSLGMVLHGSENTLAVTMDDMVYHTRQVAAGTRNALIVSDMPYQSYRTPRHALDNATRLVETGGAEVVKLERGDPPICEAVHTLVSHNIPVCGHLGLTPQSINELGGYTLQGDNPAAAAHIKQQATALQAAGASLLVLECVPPSLAASLTAALHIPVIGIGAGAHCDGQVLVVYDMLGISERSPKFSKNFLVETSVQDAVQTYVKAVKAGEFPTADHA